MRMLLILLGVMAATAQQAPRDALSIRGLVVQPGTLEPVPKAVVRLAKDSQSEPLIFTTGADGRFEFQNVVAGTYDLTATRNGFLPTTLGKRGPSGSGRKLAVAAGSNVENLRLLMTATGAISGRVSDNTGEPLANVPVHALKYSYEDGKRTLTAVKSAQTNDFGEFRLFWLPPGQYYISAQPHDGRSPNVFVLRHSTGGRSVSFDALGMVVQADEAEVSGQKPGVAYVPVFYPGTADPQSASRIEVRPGSDVRGIDFILSPVTTRKIRGTVFNSVTGQPASVANVQLIPRGDIGDSFTGTMDQGKFEVSGVLPGAYFLVATFRDGSRDDVRTFGGRTAVEVGYSDLDNINVTLHPAVPIRGRLLLEGVTDSLYSPPVIFLQGERENIFPSLSQAFATFSNSTEFEMNTVVEGDYKIWWDRLPRGTYIKSVMFGAVDALTSGLRIDARSTESIQIVLSVNAGALEGVVRDNLRSIVPGARVALVPDAAHRQLAHLYQSTTTDESGIFLLQGIPPGDYKLFAWEDIESGQWQDGEFLTRHESAGRPVHIIENGRQTIEATAIPYAF